MANRSAQVVGDGICERLQFLVGGFQIGRAPAKLLVQATNLVFPASAIGNVVVCFQDRDRSTMFIALERPSARYNHLSSISFCVPEFTLPTPFGQQLRPKRLCSILLRLAGWCGKDRS